MTSYWAAATAEAGRPINVFTRTYDAAIEHDLSQAPAGSLIHCDTGGGTPAGDQQRHYALAAGALSRHARARGLARITQIYEVDSIPTGLETFWIGGFKEPETCTAVVFEQPLI